MVFIYFLPDDRMNCIHFCPDSRGPAILSYKHSVLSLFLRLKPRHKTEQKKFIPSCLPSSIMLILILKNSNIGHTFNRNASTGTVQTYSPDKRTNRLTGDEVKVNCRITLCSGKGNGIQLLQATELQVSHLNTFRNKLPHFLFSNNAIVSQLNLLFDLFFLGGEEKCGVSSTHAAGHRLDQDEQPFWPGRNQK